MTFEGLHNQKIYAGEYQPPSDLSEEPQEPQDSNMIRVAFRLC